VRSCGAAGTPRPATKHSNLSLRQGNAEWGVRDVDAVEALAARAGLALIEVVEMPADNFMLVLGRPKKC
jgi:hypothetical protein